MTLVWDLSLLLFRAILSRPSPQWRLPYWSSCLIFLFYPLCWYTPLHSRRNLCLSLLGLVLGDWLRELLMLTVCCLGIKAQETTPSGEIHRFWEGVKKKPNVSLGCSDTTLVAGAMCRPLQVTLTFCSLVKREIEDSHFISATSSMPLQVCAPFCRTLPFRKKKILRKRRLQMPYCLLGKEDLKNTKCIIQRAWETSSQIKLLGKKIRWEGGSLQL